MEKNTEFFNTWMNSQEKLLNNWADLTNNFQKVLFEAEGKKEGAEKATQDIFAFYSTWVKGVGKYFEEIVKNYPLNMGKDAFSKLFSEADSYTKLQEFWISIYTKLKEKNFQFDSYEDLFDSAQYKAVIDKTFGFSLPETIAEFYGQAAKLSGAWGPSAQNFVKPWLEALQKNIDIFPDFIAGKPEASINAFNNVFSAFDNTFGRTLRISPVGKDREKVALMMKCLAKFSSYMNKNTQFQHQIYVTAQKSIAEIINTISKKAQNGEKIDCYEDFFKIWTDINEETYFNLFKTDEFSKLQGELLDIALDVKKHFQKLIELHLEDFPIALRSEVDDIYKIIYDLKKKVRTLEKKLKIVMEKETAK